jgi:hypothetical protein
METAEDRLSEVAHKGDCCKAPGGNDGLRACSEHPSRRVGWLVAEAVSSRAKEQRLSMKTPDCSGVLVKPYYKEGLKYS